MANPFQYDPRQFSPYSSSPQTFPSAQQFFPQPQGNVYCINNTLEVANVPAGAGITVALCVPEELMYVKSIQNGQPMLLAYKLIPYIEEEKKTGDPLLEERIAKLEEKIVELVKELKF